MRTYLSIILMVTVLLTMNTVAWAMGVDTSSPELPPEGIYASGTGSYVYSALGITLENPSLEPFVGRTIRTPVGNDEIETFDAVFKAVEIGQGWGPLTLTGPVQVRTHDRLLSTTGLFDAEIVSMSLSGSSPGGPIEIREDPVFASTGQTEITDLGGGLYHIDSFFDVFTELSPDGGNSWVAADNSMRLTLEAVPEPEPTILCLLGIAGLAMLRRRKA